VRLEERKDITGSEGVNGSCQCQRQRIMELSASVREQLVSGVGCQFNCQRYREKTAEIEDGDENEHD
jgi:hypothetical protein